MNSDEEGGGDGKMYVVLSLNVEKVCWNIVRLFLFLSDMKLIITVIANCNQQFVIQFKFFTYCCYLRHFYC
jgi:hypothetical protein